MSILNILITFVYMISFSINLHSRIDTYEQGLIFKSFSLSLATVFFLGAITLFPVIFDRIVFRRSLFLLAIFYVYYLCKIVTDIPSRSVLNTLIAYTLTDRGGTLLFYLLGFMTGFALRRSFVSCCLSPRGLNFFVLGFTVYLAITNFVLIDKCLSLSRLLRTDFVIIETTINTVREYQIVGDLLTISLLITSLFVIFLVRLILFFKKRLFQFWVCLFAIGYSIIVTATLFICIITGANKATLSVVMVATCTVIAALFNQDSKLVKPPLSNLKWFSMSLAVRVTLRLVLPITVLILAALALVNYANYFGYDLEKTRLFNFGEGSVNSSLVARNELAELNFLRHWRYSPIFGNMNVDAETTGRGTYVHSVPLYLLTHTGIVGFTMFFVYIFFATKELFCLPCIYQVRGYPLSISNSLRIFSSLITLALFLLSTVSVILSWIPLWFVMGLTFAPIGFVRTKY
ncbi:MAG: hypothetical protein ACL9RN_11840 [Cylindrospermopsis raciborskii]|uniref:hypothetical protein n=1 Tax=Cylindrospermopsis raciborskii TaxID=77022 RepID=UPI003D0AE7E4